MLAIEAWELEDEITIGSAKRLKVATWRIEKEMLDEYPPLFYQDDKIYVQEKLCIRYFFIILEISKYAT
jgi:hypothetical protein